ncbi:MAG TPA: sigma-54 dependent transcriptional regulator [Terriglobia bacterium]|jgi:transcriptional regulator with GAF, ATPase, and Fis domain
MRDRVQTPAGLERVKRDVLFEVFVVERSSCLPRDHVNERSNVGGIDLHFVCDLFGACAAIPGMIGQSSVMQTLRERVKAAARVSGSVLVTGESGTGKELVARSIHDHSERSGGKFVAVDCGALPDDLIESELFGHKRGAFTTALADKPGLFEEANGGTLFLDEIANTSRRFQAKLLRVLQDRQLRRVGDLILRKLDLRVIAATNCDLMTMVRTGGFREDLYYRLSVFPIQVPPLRRRLDDVPLLVEHVLRGRKAITDEAMEKLAGYRFPGNIRELENIVEAAVCVAVGDVIELEHVALPAETFHTWQTEEIILGNFWDTVARPYSERLITKGQLEHLIRQGLERTRGSYKKMLPLFRIPESDYKRFMDFLRRHHCHPDYRAFRKK